MGKGYYIRGNVVYIEDKNTKNPEVLNKALEELKKISGFPKKEGKVRKDLSRRLNDGFSD